MPTAYTLRDYDGILQGSRIFFGRGISSELKETYMVAKQHGRIIESLPADLRRAAHASPA